MPMCAGLATYAHTMLQTTMYYQRGVATNQIHALANDPPFCSQDPSGRWLSRLFAARLGGDESERQRV
jgi:hypothetical protein